jgi:hypothetical protein
MIVIPFTHSVHSEVSGAELKNERTERRPLVRK